MRVVGEADVTGDKSETFPRIFSRNISLYTFVNFVPFRVTSSYQFLFPFDTFNTFYTRKNELNMKDTNDMGREYIYPVVIYLQCALS